MPFPRPTALLVCAALGLGWAPAAGPAEAAPRRAAVLPAWSIVGEHVLDLDPGLVSVRGTYAFTFDGQPGSVSLQYDVKKGGLAGGGGVGLTFVDVRGTTTSEEGVQRVRFAENFAEPGFSFDGVLEDNDLDVLGTMVHEDGWGGLPGRVEETVQLRRQARTPPPSTFRLTFASTMDRRGVVRGRKVEGREERATLVVYDDEPLAGGVVRGKVTTNGDTGETSATLRVRGKGWSVTLTGPVDGDGFHALADVRARGFVLDDVPILVPVQPGPEPPPPPPPPPPKNLVKDGLARIVAGQVTITRNNLPSRYWNAFGRGADLTVEFPQAEFQTAMTADPSTSSGAAPKRCFVRNGTRTWGSAATGGSVALSVNQRPDGSYVFSTTPGQTIEVLCKGTVADASGRLKTIDVLVQARVQ